MKKNVIITTLLFIYNTTPSLGTSTDLALDVTTELFERKSSSSNHSSRDFISSFCSRLNGRNTSAFGWAPDSENKLEAATINRKKTFKLADLEVGTPEYYACLIEEKAYSYVISSQAEADYYNGNASGGETQYRNLFKAHVTFGYSRTIYKNLTDNMPREQFLIKLLNWRFSLAQKSKILLEEASYNSTSNKSMSYNENRAKTNKHHSIHQRLFKLKCAINRWHHASTMIKLGVMELRARDEEPSKELELLLRASTTLLPHLKNTSLSNFGHPGQAISPDHQEDPEYLRPYPIREIGYYELYIKKYSMERLYSINQWQHGLEKIDGTAFELARQYGLTSRKQQELKTTNPQWRLNDLSPFYIQCTYWLELCERNPLPKLNFFEVVDDRVTAIEVSVSANTRIEDDYESGLENEPSTDKLPTALLLDAPEILSPRRSQRDKWISRIKNPITPPVVKQLTTETNLDYDAEQPEGSDIYENLSTGFQNIVDSIFRLNRHKVNTRKYFSLLKHIYGKRCMKTFGSHGSHLTIYDQNRKTIGYSHELHGGRDRYSPSELKYMRDLLEENGVYPPIMEL